MSGPPTEPMRGPGATNVWSGLHYRRSLASRVTVLTTLAVGLLTLGIPYFRPMAEIFDFVPLSWHLLATMLAVVFAYIAATEFAKAAFYRKHAGSARPGRAALR